MVEAMAVLHGRDGFRHVVLPQDLDAMVEALQAGQPVLVELATTDAAVLEGVRDRAEHLFDEFPKGRLVVVVEIDAAPDDVHRLPFGLLIDHRTLAVLPEEVVRIHPDIMEQGGLVHTVMHRTGGVPALVASRPRPPRTRHRRL